MSVVIGVRIPKKLKEELEQLGIDYAREIREYLQRRVKEEKAKKLAEALDKLIEQAIEKDYSTTWIWDERESRS